MGYQVVYGFELGIGIQQGPQQSRPSNTARHFLVVLRSTAGRFGLPLYRAERSLSPVDDELTFDMTRGRRGSDRQHGCNGASRPGPCWVIDVTVESI